MTLNIASRVGNLKKSNMNLKIQSILMILSIALAESVSGPQSNYFESNEELRVKPLINKCTDQDQGMNSVELDIPADFNLSNDTSPLFFRLLPKATPFTCPAHEDLDPPKPYKVLFYINDNYEDFVDQPPSELQSWQNYDDDSQIWFLQSGELVHAFRGTHTFYHQHEYCLRKLSDSTIEAKFCLSSCDPKFMEDEDVTFQKERTLKELCLQKCCQLDQTLVVDTVQANNDMVCRPVQGPNGGRRWIPNFYSSASLNNFCVSKAENKNLSIRYRIQTLDYNISHFVSNVQLHHYQRQRWLLLENGSLVTRNFLKNPITLTPKWNQMPQQFCIDGIQNLNPETDPRKHQAIGILNLNIVTSKVFVPIPITSGMFMERGQAYLYIGANFLSLLPLGLTLMTYLMTWKFQNVHSWTIVSHVLSLFLFNVFVGTAFYKSTEEGSKGSSSCLVVGILAHFFFLATFFWLTIVNIDIWVTLRSFNRSRSKRKDFLRFLGYSTFAWGCPLVLVLMGIFMDEKYGVHGSEDDDCEIVAPNYGQFSCFISEEAAGLYLYYILGLLMVLNLTLSLFTFRGLYLQKRMTRNLRSSTDQTISIKLFVKLFTVMGISLLAEFIGWIYLVVNHDSFVNGHVRPWVLVILDCMNWSSRAFLIFIIFACKKNTLKEITSRTTTRLRDYFSCLITKSQPRNMNSFNGVDKKNHSTPSAGTISTSIGRTIDHDHLDDDRN